MVVVKGGCKEVVGRREAVERVDDVGGEYDDELTELNKTVTICVVEKTGRDVTFKCVFPFFNSLDN